MTDLFFHRDYSRSDRDVSNGTHRDTIGHWIAAAAFAIAIVFVLLNAKVAGG